MVDSVQHNPIDVGTYYIIKLTEFTKYLFISMVDYKMEVMENMEGLKVTYSV